MTDNKQAREKLIESAKEFVLKTKYIYAAEIARDPEVLRIMADFAIEVGTLDGAALQPLDDETGLTRLLSAAKRVVANKDVSHLRALRYAVDDLDSAIRQLPEAWNRRQGSLDGGWVEIKSEDDLPKVEGEFVVFTENDRKYVWSYLPGDPLGDWAEVTHWMPIPEFVAGESDGKSDGKEEM